MVTGHWSVVSGQWSPLLVRRPVYGVGSRVTVAADQKASVAALPVSEPRRAGPHDRSWGEVKLGTGQCSTGPGV